MSISPPKLHSPWIYGDHSYEMPCHAHKSSVWKWSSRRSNCRWNWRLAKRKILRGSSSTQIRNWPVGVDALSGSQDAVTVKISLYCSSEVFGMRLFFYDRVNGRWTSIHTIMDPDDYISATSTPEHSVCDVHLGSKALHNSIETSKSSRQEATRSIGSD